MIITDELGARLLVARELVDAPGVLEAASDELRKKIIHTGEDVGAFIRPESVWITRDGIDAATSSEKVTAQWSPDPTTGIILRGGPLDGEEEVGLRREDDGRPMRLFRVPTAADTPLGRTLIADYARAGIDSERDQWVYEFVRLS